MENRGNVSSWTTGAFFLKNAPFQQIQICSAVISFWLSCALGKETRLPLLFKQELLTGTFVAPREHIFFTEGKCRIKEKWCTVGEAMMLQLMAAR